MDYVQQALVVAAFVCRASLSFLLCRLRMNMVNLHQTRPLQQASNAAQ